MKKVCIIGVGLIGGSIGMDIKRLHLADEVTGVVRRKESIEESKRLGAVDRATLVLSEGIKDAGMIILATPVSKIIPFAEKLNTKAIVIDVASVKGKIVRELERILGPKYVGTHPIAGSEKKGVSGSRINLFKGTTCIITPTKNTNKEALRTVTEFWKKLGANVVTMCADEHDKLVALTSHLPHLVATSLVNTVVSQPETEPCIGTGFKDTTRIASSHPPLWQEICEWNKEAILDSLKNFKNELSDVEETVKSSNWNELLNKLIKAKELRDKWKQ